MSSAKFAVSLIHQIDSNIYLSLVWNRLLRKLHETYHAKILLRVLTWIFESVRFRLGGCRQTCEVGLCYMLVNTTTR